MKTRYRRIVAKFGTNLLTGGGDELDIEHISQLVAQVAALRWSGARGSASLAAAIAATSRFARSSPPWAKVS